MLSKINTRGRIACLGSCAALTLVTVVGCQNDAQAGALLGAGIGALAGQAIGNDTESTVIGTAVGAGAGYVIGNESDKTKSTQRWGNYDY